MKHNWEYKKLGEVCEVLYGYPFDSSYFNTDGQGMPLIRIRDVKPGKTSTFYSDSNYSNEYIIKKGDYLIGMDGEFNISPWKSDEALLNQRVCKISSKDSLFTHYLFYFLILELKKIEDKTPFVTVKHLSDKVLKSIKVPIPNVSIQEFIVNELDEINGMIEGRKEQIRLLDQLAQSIFYEMFGDPITNPKGWDVKKVKEIIQPKNNIERSSKKLKNDDKIIYIDISSIDRNSNKITNSQIYIYSEAPSRAQQILQKNDVLISLVRPNLKNIAVNKYKGVNIVGSSGFCVLRNNEYSHYTYLFSCLLTDSVTSYLCQKINGAAYPAVREEDIKEMCLAVPPVKLQEEFAAKIEMIEEQKKDIENSIKELETLLASRMDYWFN